MRKLVEVSRLSGMESLAEKHESIVTITALKAAHQPDRSAVVKKKPGNCHGSSSHSLVASSVVLISCIKVSYVNLWVSMTTFANFPP